MADKGSGKADEARRLREANAARLAGDKTPAARMTRAELERATVAVSGDTVVKDRGGPVPRKATPAQRQAARQERTRKRRERAAGGKQ